jgi:hypothetical protein
MPAGPAAYMVTGPSCTSAAGAVRARVGERTRLRLSRISIARCAGLVPLLRVCLGPSRHGQCTVPWEGAPWTNVPAPGTFGPAAQLLLAD